MHYIYNGLGRLVVSLIVTVVFVVVAHAQNCSPPPSDMISWWPFDNNSEDVAGENDGVLVGSNSYELGMVDQGYAGTPGHLVLVNNAPSLDVTNFTIDTWVRVDEITSGVNMAIVWKGSSNGSSYTTPYAVSISGTTDLSPDVNIELGSVYATLGNDPLSERQHISTRQSSYAIPLGTFTHIAVTADETTFSIYINGETRASAPRTVTPYTNDFPLQIGGVLNGDPFRDGYFLNGIIDELEIHSRALSGPEIMAIFNAGVAGKCKCVDPPSDLVDWWPFDGNQDDLGRGTSGVLVGGTYVAGKVGQGFKSVANGLVRDGNLIGVGLTNFTIDAWVRVDEITSGVNMAIVWKGSSSGSSVTTSYAVSVSGTTDLSADVNIEPGSVYATLGNEPLTARQHVSTRQSAYTIPIGVFTHIAVTANETTFSIYMDGELKATAPRTVPPYTNDFPVQIGGVLNGDPARDGYFLNGVIDELEIHSRALSEPEIMEIVIGGSAGKCKKGYTPIGTSVMVSLDGIALTYSEVLTAGETIALRTTSGPQPPSNFTVLPLTLPIFFDIQSSATYTSPLSVCFTYDDGHFSGNESDLRLFHYEAGTWVDITTTQDFTNNFICGSANSLSPFILAEPSCACDCHADPVCDAIRSNVQDVVATISVAFRGAAAIPDPNGACPYETTDMNCDTFTSVIDVVKVVNVAFRGASAATEFCNPCP